METKDDEIISDKIHLPMEMMDYISKQLEDTDCLAISLSGKFQGFDSLYNSKRWYITLILKECSTVLH